MAENGALSRSKRRFVAAMLEAPNIRAAAKAACVGERTAWTYLSDPDVKGALTVHQDAVLGDAARRLAHEMGKALDVLCSIMQSATATDAARVSAARAVLDSGLRLAELVALADRVAELERRLEAINEG